MPKSMEEILGPLEKRGERRVPGTRENESEKFRYVSSDGSNPPKQFGKVVWQVNPPFVRSGGVILEGCRIHLPDGVVFYPLRMNGDLPAWQRQIEEGARQRGLLSAKIKGDTFVVSDGRSIPLAQCRVEFVD
jgi:hypothetical protein